MKLSQYAKKHSITYKTAWSYFKDGKIPGAFQTHTGTVVIPDELVSDKQIYTIIYVRISSNSKSELNVNMLDAQAERLVNFCINNGIKVNEVVKETASGLNENRPKLLKILKDKKATTIVVEHKDRLTRFGFSFIETLYPGKILVVNDTEDKKEDLIQDFISIITSFCARIYGNRRSKRKTEKILEELKNDN